MTTTPTEAARVRSRVDHPIIDADGHFVELGPLRPVARVGFTMLHIDVGDRVSFGMFSPRVGAGLWFTSRWLDAGVSVFSEYFWRWVGGPSGYVQGVTFELRLPLRKLPPARYAPR